MHSKVHSMRVCFVRPRNFPAMSIFFPPCQHLLCEAAGITYQRTDNVSLTKRSQPAGLSNCRPGGGGGGTPYNGLYGEAPPERGTFFSLQVYKRVGISQV